MTTLSLIITGTMTLFGLVGIGLAVRYYIELHKWARLCQNGRIFIAYNNKVKLEGPITEWVEWTRMLTKDEQSTGRIIYQANKLRVGISHRPPNSTTIKTVTTPESEAA